MRFLVLNARAADPDDQRFAPLTDRIIDLLQRARIAELPIAHLHGAQDGAATLAIPIGRYDPVYKTDDLKREVPSGLIDYLVGSPSKSINLVGAASRANIKRLSALLADIGFAARMQAETIVSIDDH